MRQLALSSLVLLVLFVSISWGRQESLTAEEKQKLEKIDRVLADVIAISDAGIRIYRGHRPFSTA